MCDFVHLHCHTQFSLLDGASDIGGMMDKAKLDGQKGVALTDHGNMFGAFKFVNEAKKRDLKPILGCEFYLVEDRHKKSFARGQGERDVRYHQLLLAKNAKGYTNLSKLCSLGFLEGLYNDFPRIDRELLVQYTEGVVATSCCIGAELPQTIIHQGIDAAEKKLKWWLDIFGEDYYIELQRHTGLENIDGLGISQEDVNQALLTLAKKHNVRVIATNDSHYVNEEDSKPHDILLCINTGNKVEDDNRFRFPSSDFYFKTKDEMATLFSDVPESLENTLAIYDKIDVLDLARDVLLPAFPLPKGFKNQEDYLRHLTYVGAKRRYPDITAEIEQRLDFELSVINHTGYPGYFLIVQDFTSMARTLGVSVGPGRGSAAGSAVAYCLGITNIDPIKYDLLFERFLNPDRISLPDIDIDFDDEGRSKVIDYVIEKYGQNQVAQIITYGSMAAKMSIRDVGRVLDVPLDQVNQVSKNFPVNLSASLKGILAEGGISPKLKEKLNSDDITRAEEIRKMAAGDDLIAQTLQMAKVLEGSVRNTGIHACGVIITPDDIREFVPVAKAKDSDLFVTQFDNSVVEDAGLLKMDFLGLKTLTIIKKAIEVIHQRHGDTIDPDEIPLDDEKTYELFQHGDTIGIFQYESTGMQRYLRELKPNKFEDLIAMNALYRPGPLQYIPNFIARKHGQEPISYDLQAMEEYLAETYGITVYQEQVMLLSQKLAGFTKGEADMLRKGMGKKQKKILDELYPKFVDGCQQNGHDPEVVGKVWKDWEAFASYAFNKSHSTCYAYIAFQTAYLKAHYPAEFMASVLACNIKDISKLEFFLRECKRMGLQVNAPNINESQSSFSVNEQGAIVIGMSAVKNVGENAVLDIIIEREANGNFVDVFDFIKRANYSSFNKKAFENLVLSGAFDTMDVARSAFFHPSEKYDTFIEHLIKFGQSYQQNKNQMAASLFGDIEELQIQNPKIPVHEKWNNLVQLNKEKEVVGVYVSGHPLDPFALALQHLTDVPLNKFEDQASHGRHIRLGGIISQVQHGVSQKYNYGFAKFTLSDFNGQYEFYVNKEVYAQFKPLLDVSNVVQIEGHFKEQNWGNSAGNIRFYPQKISLLTSAWDNFLKSITVFVPLQSIDAKALSKLQEILASNIGEYPMILKIKDEEENILELASSTKVDIDDSLIEAIASCGFGYRLN